LRKFAGIQALLLGEENVFGDQPEIKQLNVTSVEEFETLGMAVLSVAGSRPDRCEFLCGLFGGLAEQFVGEAAERVRAMVDTEVARARPGSALELFRLHWSERRIVGVSMDPLETAITSGSADLVSAAWTGDHPRILELLILAADFHRLNIVRWLLAKGTPLVREMFVYFCLSYSTRAARRTESG
jgi:hypothetical protein